MECPICYETAAVDNCQRLKCPHSICKLCLSKLHQHLCPLCRAPFDFTCEQHFLHTNNEINIEWEDISNYDFEFSVEVRTSNRHRRRRNRRNGIVGNNDSASHVPLAISEVDISEILYETHISRDELIPLMSESDKDKQKVRNGRNRWKEHYTHNTATSSGR
jgi:hypothetical protein